MGCETKSPRLACLLPLFAWMRGRRRTTDLALDPPRDWWYSPSTVSKLITSLQPELGEKTALTAALGLCKGNRMETIEPL